MKTDAALPNERWDDLQTGGMKILQKLRGFRFGMDSILLKDFVRLKPNETAADFGTGSGVLPLLLSQKEKTARFHAFEWQADIADMAARSIKANRLENRISVHCEDLRRADAVLGRESTGRRRVQSALRQKGHCADQQKRNEAAVPSRDLL